MASARSPIRTRAVAVDRRARSEEGAREPRDAPDRGTSRGPGWCPEFTRCRTAGCQATEASSLPARGEAPVEELQGSRPDGRWRVCPRVGADPAADPPRPEPADPGRERLVLDQHRSSRKEARGGVVCVQEAPYGVLVMTTTRSTGTSESQSVRGVSPTMGSQPVRPRWTFPRPEPRVRVRRCLPPLTKPARVCL